jgi:hypothetical protein
MEFTVPQGFSLAVNRCPAPKGRTDDDSWRGILSASHVPA